MRFSAGDVVYVRGASWVIDEATPQEDCTLLNLSAEGPVGTRRSCRLLLPFDRPVPSARVVRIAAMKPRRWMRHLHSKLGDLCTHGHLREAAQASIDILPFQLEPSLALIDGTASRFLLADEVGLGKTVQAGLMVAELRRRGWCERALILVPSGLRRQWADELKRRFDMPSVIVDAEVLSSLTHSLPRDVNPWSVEPVIITSIDFIKQPEVLNGVRGQLWDILIVDEAHHAASASLRREAVTMLAARSRNVVLLTATPHAGDPEAYRALCNLGRLEPEESILLFRRTRQQAGLPRSRRVHLLPVRLTADAIEMHRLLESYVARVWRIAQSTGSRELQLTAIVLSKRAFSSAQSLAASVERRLGAISGILPQPVQPSFLFDPDDAPDDEAPHSATPAFDRIDEEETILRTLLAAATRAKAGERKFLVLGRLLRRVHEPVIVFTEYRDTLKALERQFEAMRKVTTIHGGQTSEERRDAIHRFTSGSSDLLLATDAGAEGLNLHGRCRLVVNLELPWNPVRLEQRIGRVDRIGQPRTVHAINLYADRTAESTVLASLLRRLDCINASEIEVAASIISSAPLPGRSNQVSESCAQTSDLSSRALTEAARMATARIQGHQPARLADGIVPVTLVRLRDLRVADRITTHGHAVYFVRLRLANGAGRLVENTLLPVEVRGVGCHALAQGLRRRDVRAGAEQMLRQHEPAVIGFASRLGQERAAAIERETAESVRRTIRRERHISEIAAAELAPIQPGLFDNRTLRRQFSEEQQHRRIVGECAGRAALVEAGATTVLAHEPQIEMVLIPC